MSTATVAILGTHYADFAIEEAALGHLGVRLVVGTGESADDIVDVAGDADVIMAGSRPRFDASVIERLSCRAIVRYGVGVDSIDLEAAERSGMWVVRVSDYGTEAVAVHAVTLALTATRRLREADASVRAGRWSFADLRPLHLPSTLTAGVVGFGRIGRYTAGLLAGLGFRVLATDPYAEVASDSFRVTAATLADLLAECDIVSLHLPGMAGDRPLLDSAALARMKEGSVLVNTARGSLVDTRALAGGMKMDRPRLAALDVFRPEPADLATFDGVADRLILSPHMAWYTRESETDMRTKAAQDAARLVRGELPLDVVVDPGIAGEDDIS